MKKNIARHVEYALVVRVGGEDGDSGEDGASKRGRSGQADPSDARKIARL